MEKRGFYQPQEEDVGTRLFNQAKVYQERKNRMKQELEQERMENENKELSFRPKINKRDGSSS